VNTGSVGRPKDGDWRAGYTLVSFDQQAVAIELVRVEYDLDRAVQGLLSSDLPDDFAEYLQTGGKSVSAGKEA
jgi:hypothetical protein